MAGPATPAGDQTPFVDRIEARALLRSRFEQACEGEGQVVLLYGEPGIGKSRLAQTFREAVRDTPHTWLEAGASPEFSQTPFYAWSAVLHQLVGGADEPPAARAGLLAEALTRAGLDPERALRAVAPLLGIHVPDGYPPELASPEVARRRLLAALAAWVFGVARVEPVVILIEDLHWADPSTLDVLHLLVEQGATARLLLLCTARPEFVVSWPERVHVTQLTVSRLRGHHVREMVIGVATRSVLLAEVIDQLAARTDGVPLFVEELTKAVIEAGSAAATRELPGTLADSLLARIDRLGADAKAVAQAAAVCGRDFRYDLLHGVHPIGDDELRSALQALVRAELLHVRGFAPEATYTFKHALVQDFAYGSLPEERRRALHGRVAATLTARYPELAEEHPEVLARHYEEAGEDDAAVGAWQRAGERALRRGAFSEADSHLRRGLDRLARLPEAPGRATRELPLQFSLCFALSLRCGYGAPETTAGWARAREIAQDIADPLQRCSLLGGVWLMTVAREGPGAAQPLADELLRAAGESGSSWYLAWGHLTQAVTRLHAGDYAGAYEHTTLARQHTGAEAPILEFFDWRVVALGYAMRAAWHLGRAAEAHRHAAALAECAEASGRGSDRAMAYQLRAGFYGPLIGDLQAAEADAERGLAACAEAPNPTQESLLRSILGWVRSQQGQGEAGLAMMRSALDMFLTTGQRLSLGFRLGVLVDGYALAGQTAEALRVLEESESACPSEAYLRPTQLCQRAELLDRTGAAPSDVAAAYQGGLACARAQGTWAHELHIALSYARWLGHRDRHAEARDLLSPLCARLSDDDHSRAAREARAALQEPDGSDLRAGRRG